MVKKILIANWKMNINYNQAYSLSKKIFNKIKLLKEKELILLPSLEAILYIKNKIYPNLAIFGAQNCSTCINGAFTGDISAEMIKKIGCKYVLIGHSERRSLY